MNKEWYDNNIKSDLKVEEKNSEKEIRLKSLKIVIADGDSKAHFIIQTIVFLDIAVEENNAGFKVVASTENAKAMKVLSNTLALAAPGGFINIFIDESEPIGIRGQAAALGNVPDYISKQLAAFEEKKKRGTVKAMPIQTLFEPLSQRERDVLQLVAQGLSNNEISDRLSIAMDTVKGHNRSSFAKLQVQRRTEAIARARELGLI
jgi:ATP/maltotriose-dependent transcriptional regulator MalT